MMSTKDLAATLKPPNVTGASFLQVTFSIHLVSAIKHRGYQARRNLVPHPALAPFVLVHKSQHTENIAYAERRFSKLPP